MDIIISFLSQLLLTLSGRTGPATQKQPGLGLVRSAISHLKVLSGDKFCFRKPPISTLIPQDVSIKEPGSGRETFETRPNLRAGFNQLNPADSPKTEPLRADRSIL